MKTFRPCDYCGKPIGLVTGAEVYPRSPSLAAKYFWVCWPCKAWVGCHPRTKKPLGRIANAELRTWKQKAHAAFDPHWKSGRYTRKEAYKRLAERLGIPENQAHIGMFGVEMCQNVVKVCGGSIRDGQQIKAARSHR